MEAKGRQELYEKQSPEVLRTLRELAIVESTESSNRIEGVTVDPGRLRPLVLGRARPRDRSEEEIVGYRNALSWIHTDPGAIAVTPDTIRRLHATAQAGASDAGQWKARDNEILEVLEVLPDGRRIVRFRLVAARATPEGIEQLCLGYRHVADQALLPPLLAVANFVLDFLCVHPFRDGNGRVSRLLTLLLLYHHGFRVGRYVSSDVERACPGVSRDTIRLVLRALQKEKRLVCLG